MEERKERDFNSVFVGIDKVRADINNELSAIKEIHSEMEIELKKAKIYNAFMFVIAIASLGMALASLIIALR